MTDLKQAMLALADNIDHTEHGQDAEHVDCCRECSRWPRYRTLWPCIYHEHAEKIRAAVQETEPVKVYPCPWVVMGRPDQPDNSTWGMDKIACTLARGHDGKHITSDGFEFGDDQPKCFTCKGTGTNYDSATGLMICNRCNGSGKRFTNEERDAGRTPGDTDPCPWRGCLKVKGHDGDHYFTRLQG